MQYHYSPATTAFTLAAALLLAGETTEAAALIDARALLATLPADGHQRIGYCGQILTLVRSRPDILRRLIDGGELCPRRVGAALADAGGTIGEIVSLFPTERAAALVAA